MAEIVKTPEVLGGKPRIDGRRIGVHHIIADVFEGDMPPERIATEYDLDIADVYRAITYYYDNPEEIRAVQKRRREIIENADPIRPEDVGIEPRSTADPEPKSDD